MEEKAITKQKKKEFGLAPMLCLSCQCNKLLVVGIITGNLLLLYCDVCGMAQNIQLGEIKISAPTKLEPKQSPTYTG